MNKTKKFILAITLMCFVSTAAAGLFTRVRTQAHRVDVADGSAAPRVEVKGLAIYSFLGDASTPDSRLGRDSERFRVELTQAIEQRGIHVSSANALADGAQLAPSTTVRDIGSSTRTISSDAKIDAFAVARNHHAGEQALPATHRLILLPEQLINNGDGIWRGSGAMLQTSAFKVYWELEDAADHPVAAGTTSAILDIRGFPSKDMTGQIISELERLDIQFSK